jgi:Calcineurin-like phosphoesterase
MRTLIISDLHLGSGSGSDVLRRDELRAPLLKALEDIDRLVLLGDVLELRHGPPRDAMAAARPFFEDLGRTLAGRELAITAGNHDHALIEPWLARRAEEHAPSPLGVEQLLEPPGLSPMLERLAQWASPALVRVAYPGLWVRPDVYATHGHYLDCHLTIPTLERLSMGVMSRVLARPAETFARVDDYEAVCAPVFAWRDAVARDGRTGSALNGMATASVWRALGGNVAGGGGPESGQRVGARRAGASARRRLRTAALVGGFPLVVAAINRAGIGPVRADVSAGELRRAGLRAMGEVASRLGLGDAYVVFGHTHRAGPLPDEDGPEWRAGRLVNTGCWTYSPVFLTATPGESPYWPGTCVLVEDSGPPVLQRLLQDRTHAEMGHLERTL